MQIFQVLVLLFSVLGTHCSQQLIARLSTVNFTVVLFPFCFSCYSQDFTKTSEVGCEGAHPLLAI